MVTWWQDRTVEGEPGWRHRIGEAANIHERKEWVAIAKVYDRLSGDDPIVDLGSGTVTMPTRAADNR